MTITARNFMKFKTIGTPIRVTSLFALGVLAGGMASAEEVFDLGAITVTGTGFAVEVMDSPASLTVQGADQIKRIAPKSVASLLREVPGVQVSEEGVERISIRGEGAARVAILVNGQKIPDHSNYGAPILVDPTTIERIEVLRGPSSVISGSSAIGGVVNIILKKGADVPFEMTTTAGYFSATDGYRVSNTVAGTVAAGEGDLDYRVTLGRSEQGDRRTPDGVLDPSATDDKNLTAHLGWRKENQYFALDAMAFDLGAEVYTEQDGFTIDLPKRNLRKIAGSYEITDVTPWIDRIAVSAFYQSIDRTFDSDINSTNFPVAIAINALSQDAQTTKGLNGQMEMKLTEASRTLIGFEYVDDGVETDKTTTTGITNLITHGSTTTQRLGYDDASIRTTAIYGQHEIDVSPDVTASLGLRWYDVSAKLHASTTNGAANALTSNSDSGVLAAAGLVWRQSEEMTLRANLSQGYTYPTLSQLFLTTVGGSNTTYGNPDLQPEKATTFEIGARYASGAAQIDATAFYTRSNDYIAKVITGRVGNWENVDDARSYGVEVQAEYDTGKITPYASLALMRREITYANGFSTYDSGTPSVSGRIGVKGAWDAFNTSGEWDLFARGAGSAGMRGKDGVMDAVSYGGGYATVNLSVSADINESFRVSAEVGNIFDRSYEAYDQNPGAERNIAIYAVKRW